MAKATHKASQSAQAVSAAPEPDVKSVAEVTQTVNTTDAPNIPDAPLTVAPSVNVKNTERHAKACELQTCGKGWEYKRVVFHPRRHKSDPEIVKLKLNGVGLLFHREKEVICPAPYLEVCDQSLEEQFTQDPELGFKKRAPVRKYDYTTIGTATEAEYLAALKDGNAKAKKYRMTMQPA